MSNLNQNTTILFHENIFVHSMCYLQTLAILFRSLYASMQTHCNQPDDQYLIMCSVSPWLLFHQFGHVALVAILCTKPVIHQDGYVVLVAISCTKLVFYHWEIRKNIYSIISQLQTWNQHNVMAFWCNTIAQFLCCCKIYIIACFSQVDTTLSGEQTIFFGKEPSNLYLG